MKNHWSNEEKPIKLIENVLLTYLRNKKEELGLYLTKKRFLVADVFKGQLKDKLKSLIEKYHRKIVPVPTNIVNYFQPLESTIH